MARPAPRRFKGKAQLQTSTVQFMWQPLTEISYPKITFLASFEPGNVELSLEGEGSYYASDHVTIPKGTYEGQLVIGESFIHPVKEFTIEKDPETVILQFEVTPEGIGQIQYGSGYMQQNPSYGYDTYSGQDRTYGRGTERGYHGISGGSHYGRGEDRYGSSSGRRRNRSPEEPTNDFEYYQDCEYYQDYPTDLEPQRSPLNDLTPRDSDFTQAPIPHKSTSASVRPKEGGSSAYVPNNLQTSFPPALVTGAAQSISGPPGSRVTAQSVALSSELSTEATPQLISVAEASQYGSGYMQQNPSYGYDTYSGQDHTYGRGTERGYHNISGGSHYGRGEDRYGSSSGRRRNRSPEEPTNDFEYYQDYPTDLEPQRSSPSLNDLTPRDSDFTQAPIPHKSTSASVRPKEGGSSAYVPNNLQTSFPPALVTGAAQSISGPPGSRVTAQSVALSSELSTEATPQLISVAEASPQNQLNDTNSPLATHTSANAGFNVGQLQHGRESLRVDREMQAMREQLQAVTKERDYPSIGQIQYGSGYMQQNPSYGYETYSGQDHTYGRGTERGYHDISGGSHYGRGEDRYGSSSGRRRNRSPEEPTNDFEYYQDYPTDLEPQRSSPSLNDLTPQDSDFTQAPIPQEPPSTEPPSAHQKSKSTSASVRPKEGGSSAYVPNNLQTSFPPVLVTGAAQSSSGPPGSRVTAQSVALSSELSTEATPQLISVAEASPQNQLNDTNSPLATHTSANAGFNVGQLQHGRESLRVDREMQAMREQLQAVTKERDSLLENRERVNAQLEGQIRRLERQLEQAHQHEGPAEDHGALANARSVIAELESQLSSLRLKADQKGDAQKLFDELKDRNAALEEQLSEYAGLMKDQSKMIQGAMASNKAHDVETLRMQQEHIHLAEFLKKQQLENEEVLTSMKKKITQAEKIRDENVKLHQLNVSLTGELEDYRAHTKRLHEDQLELETMRQKCDAWRGEVEKLAPLRKEADQLHAQVMDLEGQVDQVTQENEGLGKQLQDVLDESERKQSEMGRKVADYDRLREWVTELQQIRAHLENELAPLREERAAILTENAQLREGSQPENYAKLREEYASLAHQFEQLQTALQEQAALVQRHEKTNMQLQQQLTDVTNPEKLQSVRDRLERYRGERDQARLQNEELQTRLHQIEMESQQNAADSQQLLSRFQQEATSWEHSNSSLVAKVEEYEGRMRRYREERNQAITSSKAFEQQISTLQGAIKELTQQNIELQQIQANAENEVGLLRDKNAAVHEENSRLRQQQVQLTGELSTTRQQLGQVTEELTETREQLSLRGHELTETREHLSQRSEELAETRQQLGQVTEELTETREQLSLRGHELTEIREQRSEELAETRQQLGQVTEELTETRKQLTTQESLHWQVAREEIQVFEDRLLGTGGWGYVVEGQFRGQRVAVKCVHRQILQPYTRNRIRREIGTMAQVRHPNLVLFIASVIDDQGSPMIITEILSINVRRAYQENRLGSSSLRIFRDIAAALNYLHQHHEPIIHRDVSTPNVLLEAMANNVWKAKLSDFGSANLVRLATTPGEGAIVYTAPEAFPRPADSPNPAPNQTPKIDVYSYGVLLCEVVTRRFPNPDDFQNMVTEVARQWPLMHTLITACRNRNPEERPTMAYILNELESCLRPRPRPRMPSTHQ